MHMGKVRAGLSLDAPAPATRHGPATVMIYTGDELLLESLTTILPPERYHLSSRRRPDSLSDFLNDRRSDAVLLDLGLPVRSRIDVGRQLRNIRNKPTIPIIGLCGQDTSYEARVGALGDGFWDVVEIPVASSELVAKLSNWVCIKRDMDELQSGMLIDLDTGHYSSQGMKRRLREVAALAHRSNDALCCVVFGADQLPAGSELSDDELLAAGRNFSLALHHQTRNSDVIGRLEALKFMVLAPHTPPVGGAKLAERFTSLSLSRRVDGEFPVTFSAGVAGVYGQNGQVQACPELLLVASNRALREARTSGTAQVAVAWGRPN